MFSNCSKASILQTIQTKAPECFKERTNKVCGNSRVDEEEECDPGLLHLQSDLCCTSDCKLKPDAKCRWGSSKLNKIKQLATEGTKMKGVGVSPESLFSYIEVNKCQFFKQELQFQKNSPIMCTNSLYGSRTPLRKFGFHGRGLKMWGELKPGLPHPDSHSIQALRKHLNSTACWP